MGTAGQSSGYGHLKGDTPGFQLVFAMKGLEPSLVNVSHLQEKL